MNTTAYPRRFVPVNLDLADGAAVEGIYRDLLAREIHSVADLQRFIEDFSELAAAADEYGSRRYIDNSCHTNDESVKNRYLHFVEEVEPRIKPLAFALQKKYLASPFREKLGRDGLAMMEKRWRADVELFRDENVAIETEVTRKVTEYDQLQGKMMVHFRGKDYTAQQMARFLEEIDRVIRQEAWELTTRRVLQDRAAFDNIFDTLLPLRDKIARNAGLRDFREYQWKANKRFDYTPDDCRKFADAIAETCVPAVRRLDERRAADMKLETLRPWDMSVDPLGRSPLRPFDPDKIDEFIGKTREIFNRLSPALAKDFDQLKANGNLDLQSRQGKRPGGYLMPLEESRQPFIFMNAAGLQRDVETLLHEGGHAFHHLAVAEENLVFLRSAPMEFCEVASMSMEFLGTEQIAVFYDDPLDSARAQRSLIEGFVRILPWIATVDSFQHWIYTHPGHTPDDRTRHWVSLLDRFSSRLDWTGWEQARQASWQRQGHIFRSPFYYIEYGIAALGAIQLWLKSREDPHRALANYRAALALGGRKPLPELFAAAGIVFEFSEKTVAPLVRAMEEQLDGLPA